MLNLETVDYEHFKRKVRIKTGLNLNAYKQGQMERRLRSFMERAGAQSFGQYYRMLEADEAFMHEFLDRVTINVSEMFRNPEQFKMVESRVIPELLSRTNYLKVWSAGCSYGQEAYSLAIMLEELAPGKGHRVLATDIDARARAAASKGQFTSLDMKNVSEERKRRWFEYRDNVFTADQKLRNMIEVRNLNLLEDKFPSGYDLIACRNVVIYFTDEAKSSLYRRFFDALRPGGYFFVGGTERINGFEAMGYKNPLPFLYQKPQR